MMMNYLFKDFKIDKRSKYSASDQLFYYIVTKLISYQMVPGEPLPTPNELSRLIKLDEADIKTAYQRLLDEWYFGPLDDSIALKITPVSRQKLRTVLDIEDSVESHGLKSSLVVKEFSNALAKITHDWMVVPKHASKKDLHRLHVGNAIPFIYSVVSMDPDSLPLGCDDCDNIEVLLDIWSNVSKPQWTTMVMFSVLLPEEIAQHFNMLPNTAAFAFRSSLLNDNGIMLATLMYIFSPRVYFHHNQKLVSHLS
jgi:DNA-binding GntR family transcriptional regulator